MNTNYIPKSGKHGTFAQDHAWGAFGSASCKWETLTEEQYRAWDEAAKKENRHRHLRRGHRLNGQNLFTQINSHQAFLGLPTYLFPPERPAFSFDPLGPLMTGAEWLHDGVAVYYSLMIALAATFTVSVRGG